MKLTGRHLTTFALLAILSLLVGCGGGGGSGDSTGSSGATGTLSVSLTDSTTDLYRAVYVTINEVQVCRNDDINPSGDDSANDVVSDDNSPDNGCSWKTLDPPDGVEFPKTYNLRKLVNGVTEAIGSGEFSAGQYNQVRLIIGNSPELENNLLGDPHPAANYVILNDGLGTVEPLKIPSGFQTGIKLVHPFPVGEGEVKELVLDFDASRSVVKAGNSGKYILKPTIKVIEAEGKVDIGGTVWDDKGTASENDDVGLPGAIVSAQISDGLSATVVRSTISAGSGNDDTNDEDGLRGGVYKLTLLSPRQLYNIVAYSERKSPVCAAFLYNDDNTSLPLDFILSDAEIATVSGTVTVEGDSISKDFPLIVTIYTELECNHPEGENYVELTKVDDNLITYVSPNIFGYKIDLPKPKNDTSARYYIVASADGYIPATITVDVQLTDSGVTDADQLRISPQQ